MEHWNSQARGGQTIVFDPLDLRDDDRAFENLMQYTSDMNSYVMLLFDQSSQWQRERVDNFLLPVRGMGVWSLYYANRALHTKGVIRAVKFCDGQIKPESYRMAERKMDGIIMYVAENAGKKWLRRLVRSFGEGEAKKIVREKAASDLQ